MDRESIFIIEKKLK